MLSLLHDEFAEVVVRLRKLFGSNHPLLQIDKNFVYNNRNNMQAWDLIILLISKTAGHLNVEDTEENKTAGVLHSQRALAEITGMLRTSYLIYKGLVNITPGIYPETPEFHDMKHGNKISILCGDYLFNNSCLELANLKNQGLVELIHISIKHMSEAEFIGRRDIQNNPLPCIPPPNRKEHAVEEWTLRNVLSAGSFLGNSCQGTLKLAGHSDEIQKQGYILMYLFKIVLR